MPFIVGFLLYGFNGKENDKDFGTAGLTQDYGFRLYNPAIAKFLSVDPLAPSYPFLTPYQFASNRPIDCIDLDGLEQLKMVINSEPTTTKSGSALITIKLDYKIVTVGLGAIKDPSNKIDTDEFKRIYSQGDRTLKMSTLPGPNKGTFIEGREKNLLAAGTLYYDVKVKYDYNLSKTDKTTLEDAYKWMMEKPNERGIMVNNFDSDKSTIPALKDNLSDANKAFEAKPKAMAWGNPSGSNIVIANSKFFTEFGYSSGLPETQQQMTPAEVLGHEAGHNSADKHRHELPTKNYEYNQAGLSSSTSGRIFPTETNTKTILVDPKNRFNIETTPKK